MRERRVRCRSCRARLSAELAAAGVDLRLGWQAERIGRIRGGLRTELRGPRRRGRTRRRPCSSTIAPYSQLNRLLAASGLPSSRSEHELTEMPLMISMPAPLRDLAVTVMDGPFFSVMPFARGVHTLSHVRYTPHRTWRDGTGGSVRSREASRASSRRELLLPHAAGCATIPAAPGRGGSPGLDAADQDLLPASETTTRAHPVPAGSRAARLTCVLGGKIDNALTSVLQELDPAAPAAVDGASTAQRRDRLSAGVMAATR